MINHYFGSRRVCAYFTAIAFQCCVSGVLLVSSTQVATAAANVGGDVIIDLPAAISTSKLVSRADADKLINIVLVLPLSDEKGADEFARRVSTPNDALYGKYLTPQESAPNLVRAWPIIQP